MDTITKATIYNRVLIDSEGKPQQELSFYEEKEYCQTSPTCLPVCLCQGSVMVLVTPGPQMLLAACARHTDNFLQECVHLKTIEKVNYCKWIFCLSSRRNPPSATTMEQREGGSQITSYSFDHVRTSNIVFLTTHGRLIQFLLGDWSAEISCDQQEESQ